jgi:hypothetical protein
MSAGRRLLVFLTGAAAAVTLIFLMIREGPRHADLPHGISAIPDWVTTDPEHALATVIGLTAWACLLWLCAGFVLGALTTLPGAGGRAATALVRRILPRALRHILEITLGVALTAGTAAPALAATPMDALIPQTVPSTSTASTGTASTGTAWPDLTRPQLPAPPSPTGVPPAPQLTPSVTTTPSTPAATGWPDLSRPSVSPVPAGPVATSTVATARLPAGTPPAPSSHSVEAGPTHTASAASTASALPTAGPIPQPTGQPSATTRPASPTTPSSPAVLASTGTPSVWPDLNRPHTPAIGPQPRGIGPSSTAPAHPAEAATPTPEVVVLRGDSLWTIAARHLGPGATTAQIAREWPRWWAANKHVIGPDPDRILPGQRLQPPRPGP